MECEWRIQEEKTRRRREREREREREIAQYSPALHLSLTKFVGATIVIGK